MQYTDEPPFPDISTVDIMLASVRRLFDEQTSLEWVLSLKDGGTVIGTCGLHSFEEPHHSAEVGCLLRRCAWGSGYMTEAISCLIQYAANPLGIRRLRADIHPENRRAVALFSALGFAPVAGGVLQLRINDVQQHLQATRQRRAPEERS